MKILKPLFWDKKNLLSFLLYPLTFITLLVILIKKFSTKKKFGLKTICIGNIYLGGTGKTSLSIAINKILNKKYKTVFIKKNYKKHMDEKILLKSYGKLIFNKQREVGLKIAQKNNFEVGIIDDGLQEKKIVYDISIVCFNSSAGIGNGFLLPAGPLRESILAIQNYDAVFLNGEKKNYKLKLYLKNINSKIYIFEGRYVATNLKKFNIKKNYIAFSGLGNPEEFERTLKKYKFKIKQKYIFPDHYKYNDSEIIKLKNIAKKKNLQIITTEKDYLRLNRKNKKDIKYLKIELQIKEREKFLNFLKNKL